MLYKKSRSFIVISRLKSEFTILILKSQSDFKIYYESYWTSKTFFEYLLNL